MATATEPREGIPTEGPRALGQKLSWSLDLPGVLPIAVIAATWEFLLLRVVVLAAQGSAEGELEGWVATLARTGLFARNLAAVIVLVLLADAVIALVRDSAFGPLTHRITVAGFAAVTVAVCAASTVLALGPEPALMGHAAAVLLGMLLVLGLLWHRVDGRLLVAAVLLLLPTLLRFFASCAISVPVLRMDAPVPLYAYQGAEVVAVATALASPLIIAGLRPRDFFSRSNLVPMGIASLPAVALSAAAAGSAAQVSALTRAAVGFGMIVPPLGVVYPVALFTFLLTIAVLVLPGLAAPRPKEDQRLGYGLALLFLAGLDGLSGAVLSIGAGIADTPELVQYLLEGNWSHMTHEQQSLVGPPLRDLYQVALLALGYVLVARGIHGRARALARKETEEGGKAQ